MSDKKSSFFRAQSSVDAAEAEILAFEQEQEQVPKEEVVVVEETPEEKTFKKRYADLQRYKAAEDKKFKEEIENLKKQLTQKPSTDLAPPRSREEVEEWVKKYPEVAGIVRSLAQEEMKGTESSLDARLKRVEAMEESISQEKALAELLKLHPDYNEINASDEFHTWAETQPHWVQHALYEDMDVASAGRAIDLYKLDTGKKTKPEKQAAASISTRSRVSPQDDNSSSMYSESRVQRMSDAEYARSEQEIEKAIREGKFVYDISRKGR